MNGLFQLLFAHVALAHDFVVVLLGKLVEHLVHNFVGQQVGGRTLVTLELQQQAFAQVRGPHAGRLELLNHLQNILDLAHRHVEPHLEDEVVGDSLDGALQIAVVVDVADDVLGNLIRGFVERLFAQLALEIVVERRGRDKGNILFLVVFREVVGFEPVVGDVVFGAVVAQRELFGRFGGISVFVGVGVVVVQAVEAFFPALFQGGVVDQLLLHALFKFHFGKFEEPDELYLLG